MFNYIKRNFEKPENSLMQVIITNGLVFAGLLIVQIIQKLTGLLSVENFFSYTCLSSDWASFRFWSMVTYFFVHKSILSLLYNMLALYTFGRIVVYLLGSKRFIMLYMCGGIIGGVVFMLSYNFLPYFIQLNQLAIKQGSAIRLMGASAALYAVTVGAATFAPNFALSFFPFFSIKLKYVILFFLISPVLYLAHGDGDEGISIASLGGALWGYLYIQYLLIRNSKYRPSWLHGLYANLKKPVQLFYKNAKKTTDSKQINTKEPTISQEEIEAILDKIAMYGYKQLTEQEKRKLFNAGK